MRILITGGAGFQGSHLAKSLIDRSHEVSILNTPSRIALANIAKLSAHCSVIWGSVTDSEIVEKAVEGNDVVIHMAAHVSVDESISNPRSFLDVNVLGTYNVLEAVKRSKARLIFASSCEVYGHQAGSLSAEDSALMPHSPYAASKASADRLCYAYRVTYNIPITIVRPCNVYGPRQKIGHGGALIPTMVDRGLRKLPLLVHGNGSQVREYIHVRDVVRAYELILTSESATATCINVGSGNLVSVNEIAAFISKMTGAPIEHGVPRPGEVAGFSLDNAPIRRLGFTPSIEFWDGLQDYMGWYKNQVLPKVAAIPR